MTEPGELPLATCDQHPSSALGLGLAVALAVLSTTLPLQRGVTALSKARLERSARPHGSVGGVPRNAPPERVATSRSSAAVLVRSAWAIK